PAGGAAADLREVLPRTGRQRHGPGARDLARNRRGARRTHRGRRSRGRRRDLPVPLAGRRRAAGDRAGATCVSASEAPGVPPPTVLVIEDEAPIRAFLRTSLAGHGYRVVEAARGEDGLVHATTHVPDVVILDLGLPDIDGLVVTRRLREWSAAPIIVL